MRTSETVRWFSAPVKRDAGSSRCYRCDVAREPAERPAPGRLELVRAFVNTWDLDKGEDHLVDPDAAAAWMAEAGLLPAGAGLRSRDLAKVLQAREAFRAVLVANAAGGGADEAVQTLNGLADEANIAIRLSGTGSVVPIVAAGGVVGALGQLVAIAFEGVTDGTWTRLKACPATGCHWAFYDTSRNRSSRWCDMGVCGNRAKRRRFRQRRAIR
jgi:predicted RNA-binding Zn ribbon-like protein